MISKFICLGLVFKTEEFSQKANEKEIKPKIQIRKQFSVFRL